MLNYAQAEIGEKLCEAAATGNTSAVRELLNTAGCNTNFTIAAVSALYTHITRSVCITNTVKGQARCELSSAPCLQAYSHIAGLASDYLHER